jgi:glycosyltransferase involved in cell wall biosynthesis
MRVLFVGSNAGGGGTESHFISLCRALADAGHEVFAAVRPEDFIHRGLAQDDRVHLCPIEFKSRRDVVAVRALVQMARRIRPDWIIGAFKLDYWGIAVAAKTAGVPLALFSHLDQRIRPVMLHRLTRLVRGVIVPSEYLRRRSIERGVPASGVAVLPNPIDEVHFASHAAIRTRIRASLGLQPDDLLLGFVGRFEPAKGVQVLAPALNNVMSSHGRLHALWVGHGASEAELRATTAATGFENRHHWMPWLDDVVPAYAAMDLLALPSVGSETFGRVLVEAQAHGIPVLGAANGGIPEALIDGQTGRLLAPGDIARWSAGITELVENDELRARLGAGAVRFAQRFASRQIARDFSRVLDSFVTPQPSIGPTPVVPVTLARKAPAD